MIRMEIEVIEREEMESRGGGGGGRTREVFNPLKKGFLERTATGTYELIDGERYDLHYDYDERKCTGGTEMTSKIVHLIAPERKESFWLSLCEKHYSKIENTGELEILESRDPVLGERYNAERVPGR